MEVLSIVGAVMLAEEEDSTRAAADVRPEAAGRDVKQEADEPVVEEEADAVGKSADAVGQTLEESVAEKRSVFGSLLTEEGRDWWTDSQASLYETLGLRLSVDYNVLAQAATDSLDDDHGSAGEFRTTARWRVWGKESGNLGLIDFQIRNRHSYSEIPPSQLGSSIGSLWPTTRGFSDSGWDVTHAYLEQYLFDKRLAFRGGQTRIDNMFDVHALRSHRHFFLNTAFSDNPAVAFPSFGLAGALRLQAADDLELMAGIADADSRQLREAVDFDLAREENLFAAAELSWKPKLLKEGNSLLQAMYWHTDPTSDGLTPAGNGISLLAQQRLPSKNTGFLRYSYSSSEATVVSHMISTGIAVHPWAERLNDFAGFAFAWGRPSTPGVRDQYVVETFYRLQITPELQLTPDVQLIIQPSFNPQHDLIAVVGVRARVAF